MATFVKSWKTICANSVKGEQTTITSSRCFFKTIEFIKQEILTKLKKTGKYSNVLNLNIWGLGIGNWGLGSHGARL